MCKIMNILKFFCIMLLQISCVTSARAQCIVCKDSSGKLIDLSGYLYPNEIYNFSRADNHNANWKFYIMPKWDYMKEIKSTQDSPSINTDFDNISFEWKYTKRYYTPTMDTCYYKGLIVSEAEGKKDSLYVNMAYAPVKPIIKEISITYDGYDYEYHMLNDPEFTCTLYLPNVSVVYTLRTDFNSGQIEEDPTFTNVFDTPIKSQDGYITINDICDTNQKMCFCAAN